MLSTLVHKAAVTIWSALPSLQYQLKDVEEKRRKEKSDYEALLEGNSNEDVSLPQYTPYPSEEEKTDLKVSADEVRLAFASLFRASFVNAIQEDCLNAANEVSVPETCSFIEFEKLLEHYIINVWADPSCLPGIKIEKTKGVGATESESRPSGINTEKISHKSLKRVEEYITDLTCCVVDDKAPFPLRPLISVWVRKLYPLTIEKPFIQFARVESYPTHPKIYDAMWQGFDCVGKMSKESFTKLFSLAYQVLFSNATVERSKAAAEPMWYDSIAASGVMRMEEFISATCQMMLKYGNGQDAVIFFTKLVELAKKQSPDSWKDARLEPLEDAKLLDDPRSLFIPDLLDSEEYETLYFKSTTANRILVTGGKGMGKSFLSARIAEKLNCVNLDVEILATEAAEDPFNEYGSEIKRLVSEQQPIPLYLQAALIKQALNRESTQHRGYVFGDIPMLNKDVESMYLSETGISDFIPQAIVNIIASDDVTEARAAMSCDHNDKKYQDELLKRRLEQESLDAAEALEQEKELRNKRNALLRETKAKIEAKEDPTEEELKLLEQQEEEVDDENDVDQEEIEAERALVNDAIRKRRFLAELHQQIVLGRREVNMETVSHINATVLANATEIIAARGRILNVGSVDNGDMSAVVIERLSLIPSVIPCPVPLSEEEMDGVDPNDEDYLGDAISRVVEEFPSTYRLSKWGRNCPVTHFDDRVTIEGAPQFTRLYRGRLYYFASKSKAAAFTAFPHRYLTQTFKLPSSVLLLQSKLNTFENSGTYFHRESPTPFTATDPFQMERLLGSELNITNTPISEFFMQWKAQQYEFTIRDNERKTRLAADVKSRKEADDRAKKLAEAEAKMRRKEKGKNKGKITVVEEKSALEPDIVSEEEKDTTESTEMRIQKGIEAKKREAAFYFAPQLVSCLGGIKIEELEFLFEMRCLPLSVVVIDHIVPKPRKLNSYGEEKEDEMSEDEANDEESVEYDDDGKLIEKPPKTIDLADPNMYEKYIKNFLGRLQEAAEIAEQEVDNPTEDELPDDKVVKPIRRSQPFTIHRVNIHNYKTTDTVSEIIHSLHPCQLKATPLGEGEELIEDDPQEEVEDIQEDILLTDPLKQGKMATHQFGITRRYCPVSIVDDDNLVTGNTELCAVHDHKKYLFSSDEKMTRFLLNPTRYLSTETPISIPPPRICIVGCRGSGKTTVSTNLSNKYNIPIFVSFTKEYFDELLNATTNGGEVRGLSIPQQSGEMNESLRRALEIRKQLTEFEEQQTYKIELKKRTEDEKLERERQIEAGEDVDELDEEEEEMIEKALEFEPEDEDEARDRKDAAWRRIGAALTRIEPFLSNGYIICVHPSSDKELQTMIDEDAYFDVVVNLKLGPTAFVERLLSEEMEVREEQYKAAVKAVEDAKCSIITKQRLVKLAQWRRRNIGKNDSSPETDEDENEIPDEPEHVAEENVREELQTQYDDEVDQIGTIINFLSEKRIEIITVNADGGYNAVTDASINGIFPYVEGRQSLLEAPLVIPYDDAIRSLWNGEKNFSSFRMEDPVIHFEKVFFEKQIDSYKFKKGNHTELQPEEEDNIKVTELGIVHEEDDRETHEEENELENVNEEELESEPELEPEELEELENQHRERLLTSAKKHLKRAAVLRNRIYFFDTDSSLIKFLKTPMKYWNQHSPLPQPKSIITIVTEATLTLAEMSDNRRLMGQHIAYCSGAVFITIPKLLKWALLCRGGFGSAIKKEILQIVTTGAKIRPAILNSILISRLLSSDVIKKGAVVTNVLAEMSDFEAIIESGIDVLCLLSFLDHEDVITTGIHQYSQVSHHVKANRWTTASLVESMKQISSSKQAMQQLVLCRSMGFPASIHYTNLTESYVDNNVTKEFKYYCPYMWKNNGQLVKVGNTRRYAAEYIGRVYFFSTKEYLDEFMIHPEFFDKANNDIQLPEILPKRLEGTLVDNLGISLELCGCCPVTLYDTQNMVGLKGVCEPIAVKGHLPVIYDGKYYAIDGECHMMRFLSQPWVFVNGAVLPMPQKIPMEKGEVAKRPTEEYIRITLYESVARAMIAAAETRPKFPGMTAEESIQKFIALYLKAFNKESSQIAAEQHMANFKEYTEISTLYKTITTDPPPDPEELEKFNRACDIWDAVQDEPTMYKKYSQLRERHKDPKIKYM